MCVRDIDFASIFLLDVGIVFTVGYFWFLIFLQQVGGFTVAGKTSFMGPAQAVF
jgi:hypothetical protein